MATSTSTKKLALGKHDLGILTTKELRFLDALGFIRRLTNGHTALDKDALAQAIANEIHANSFVTTRDELTQDGVTAELLAERICQTTSNPVYVQNDRTDLHGDPLVADAGRTFVVGEITKLVKTTTPNSNVQKRIGLLHPTGWLINAVVDRTITEQGTAVTHKVPVYACTDAADLLQDYDLGPRTERAKGLVDSKAKRDKALVDRMPQMAKHVAIAAHQVAAHAATQAQTTIKQLTDGMSDADRAAFEQEVEQMLQIGSSSSTGQLAITGAATV